MKVNELNKEELAELKRNYCSEKNKNVSITVILQL